MTIYIAIIISIITLRFFLRDVLKIKNSDIIYCAFIAIELFVISMLRSEEVGCDTASYILQYNNLTPLFDLEEILDYKDPGYLFFLKILKNLSNNSLLLLSVTSLFFVFSITRFIFKNSAHLEMSFLILFPFNYFSFSLTAIRQSIAIAILLYVYDLFISKKYFKSFLLIILASTFHQTATIFTLILVYPIFTKILRRQWQKLFFIITALWFIFSFPSTIIGFFISDSIIRSVLDTNSNQGYLTLLIFILCLVVYILRRRAIKINFMYYDLLLYIFFLGIIFQSFTPLISEFFRLSMYFNIFSIIMIPFIYTSFKNQIIKILIYPLITSLLIIMYINFTVYDSCAYPYNFNF